MSESAETTDQSSETTGATTSLGPRRSVKRKLAESFAILPEPSSPEVTEAILAAELEIEGTAAQV